MFSVINAAGSNHDQRFASLTELDISPWDFASIHGTCNLFLGRIPVKWNVHPPGARKRRCRRWLMIELTELTEVDSLAARMQII